MTRLVLRRNAAEPHEHLPFDFSTSCPSSPPPPPSPPPLIFLFYLKATKVKLQRDISIYLLAFGKAPAVRFGCHGTVNGLYLLNGKREPRHRSHLRGGDGSRYSSRWSALSLRGLVVDVDYLFYSKHVIPTTPENKEGFPLAAPQHGGRRTANCDFFTPLIAGNEAAGCRHQSFGGGGWGRGCGGFTVNTSSRISEHNGAAEGQEAGSLIQRGGQQLRTA